MPSPVDTKLGLGHTFPPSVVSRKNTPSKTTHTSHRREIDFKMGVGKFIHHIGTFLLFVSFVLLIVVDITAPVINNLSIMKVDLGRNRAGADQVTFGTFGYCLRGIE